MWTNRQSELRGEQKDREIFIHIRDVSSKTFGPRCFSDFNNASTNNCLPQAQFSDLARIKFRSEPRARNELRGTFLSGRGGGAGLYRMRTGYSRARKGVEQFFSVRTTQSGARVPSRASIERAIVTLGNVMKHSLGGGCVKHRVEEPAAGCEFLIQST